MSPSSNAGLFFTGTTKIHEAHKENVPNAFFSSIWLAEPARMAGPTASGSPLTVPVAEALRSWLNAL